MIVSNHSIFLKPNRAPMPYSTPIGPYDGKSWESLCHLCLNIRHKGKYQEVRASPGDYGIDGYTLDGEVYQFYCPERECSDKELAESLKKKINEDLTKLNIYSEQISTMLNGVPVKFWYLVTPKIPTKAIIETCNTGIQKVLSYSLPFISNNLRIMAHDYKIFTSELEIALGALGLINNPNITAKLEILDTDINVDEINSYKSTFDKEELVKNAFSKHQTLLTASGGSYTRIHARVDRTIERQLIGDYLLKEWADVAQVQYERFKRIVKKLESRVVDICDLPTDNIIERSREIESLAQTTIDEEFPELATSMRMSLTNHIIADWLLRCPLNFDSNARN